MSAAAFCRPDQSAEVVRILYFIRKNQKKIFSLLPGQFPDLIYCGISNCRNRRRNTLMRLIASHGVQLLAGHIFNRNARRFAREIICPMLPFVLLAPHKAYQSLRQP